MDTMDTDLAGLTHEGIARIRRTKRSVSEARAPTASAARGATVDSKKLECGSGTIPAGVPCSQGFGVRVQSYSDFLVSTVSWRDSRNTWTPKVRKMMAGRLLKCPDPFSIVSMSTASKEGLLEYLQRLKQLMKVIEFEVIRFKVIWMLTSFPKVSLYSTTPQSRDIGPP